MTVWFFGLVFAISRVLWIPAFLFVPQAYRLPFVIAGVLGPMLAAILVTRRARGADGLRLWLRTVFRFRIPLTL